MLSMRGNSTSAEAAGADIGCLMDASRAWEPKALSLSSDLKGENRSRFPATNPAVTMAATATSRASTTLEDFVYVQIVLYPMSKRPQFLGRIGFPSRNKQPVHDHSPE